MADHIRRIAHAHEAHEEYGNDESAEELALAINNAKEALSASPEAPKSTGDDVVSGLLDYEMASAKARGYTDCTCINHSRTTEVAYENGRCVHQQARQWLSGHATPTPDGWQDKATADGEKPFDREPFPGFDVLTDKLSDMERQAEDTAKQHGQGSQARAYCNGIAKGLREAMGVVYCVPHASPFSGDGQKLRGIYVASRASKPQRPAMWQSYRDAGHPIISTWIDEAGEGQTADNGELWQRILREITEAVGLVLYVEAEDFPLKGAFIEVGMALALGKPVHVVAPDVQLEAHTLRPLGSWASHPNVSFFETVSAALSALGVDPL
jgi:hypothetical protein